MWANEQPDDVEIWGMNEAHIFLKRYNLWFQIHPRDFKEKEKREAGIKSKLPPDSFGRNEEHIKWLRECKVPVYMKQQFDDIPNSRAFPFDEVKAYFAPYTQGRLYITSTPSYMMAYAIMQPDIEEIRISGIELAIGTEYYWQRACFEFYCGFAAGRGIKVVLPPSGCAILAAPVYGVDKSVVQPQDHNREPKMVVATPRGLAQVKQMEPVPA